MSQTDIFYESELIEPISPQAAQLDIHFFYFFPTHSWRCSWTHHWRRKVEIGTWNRKKKKKIAQHPVGFWTHDLQIPRRVLYRCATTTAESDKAAWLYGNRIALDRIQMCVEPLNKIQHSFSRRRSRKTPPWFLKRKKYLASFLNKTNLKSNSNLNNYEIEQSFKLF